TCVGGSGAGTAASPYVGATSCTLPAGSSIQTNSHSFYTVQGSDFALPGHQLTDIATLNWQDLCTGTSPNCSLSPQAAGARSATQFTLRPPAPITPAIHNAAGQTVTTVEAGTTVHDVVTLLGLPNLPPTGTVSIDWFVNGTCSGGPASNSGPLPIVNGQVDATAFAMTPHTAGQFAFLAHLTGDPLYPPSAGPCEPLAVGEANSQMPPAPAEKPPGRN